MQGKSLGEARRLFRARKFSEVIRALEPEIFRFRESLDYYILLGLSCLVTGDLGGAFSYLGKARQIDGDDVRASLGMAVIHFKRAETEEALKLWLEVLDADPSNRIAKRGMALLRRGPSAEQIQEFIDSGKVSRLYPPLPSFRISRVLIPALLIIILAGLGYLGYRIIPPRTPSRPGISEVEIPSNLPRLIEGGSGSSPYILSERQVLQEFDLAKRYLLAYRDNMAAVVINKILLSNATLPVKERARILKAHVSRPSFTTFKDGFTYRDVAKEPALYDGVSVRWKGKVANLVVGKDSIRFDFLVGYDQEKELEGIVPVTLSFAAQLDNGMPLEILAQSIMENGKLRLDGISIHRLVTQ
jgi:tetratricopeptide (TPR) repeat protein